MNVTIASPTKALLYPIGCGEIDLIIKELTYTNKSISYQLQMHKKNNWWKSKDPVTWGERFEELQNRLKGCLVTREGNQSWIRPGSIPYIESVSLSTTNAVDYPEFNPIPWSVPPEFEPYSYQSLSVEKLMSARHGNISLPTGCGKSFTLLLLAKKMGLDTVIVTPSKSIFNELLNEFQIRLGKKYVGGYGDGKKDLDKKITIAISKSLTLLKPGSEAEKFFKNKQALFIDESHTFAAEELHKVCHGVLANAPYRCFVSATQKRNDGTEKVLHSIIGKTVFSMELDKAIEKDYLCPLRFTVIETKSLSKSIVADPTKSKRAHFLYNENIAKTAASIGNASWLVQQKSTLILVDELKQIEMLTKLLEVPFAYVHSADKKKAATFGLEKVKLQDQVDRFNNGEVKVLIGTSAISTGTNIFPTHNVVNWVGGSSEIVTKQGSMGRSTRKLELSKFKDIHKPKPYSMIYDFDVTNIPMLKKQLEKRIAWYEESGGDVKYV